MGTYTNTKKHFEYINTLIHLFTSWSLSHVTWKIGKRFQPPPFFLRNEKWQIYCISESYNLESYNVFFHTERTSLWPYVLGCIFAAVLTVINNFSARLGCTWQTNAILKFVSTYGVGGDRKYSKTKVMCWRFTSAMKVSLVVWRRLVHD